MNIVYLQFFTRTQKNLFIQKFNIDIKYFLLVINFDNESRGILPLKS